jgi:hypothetical protein
MRFRALMAKVTSLWQGVQFGLIDMTMQPVHLDT